MTPSVEPDGRIPAPCCVTVDCDTLYSHHAVWGLPPPSPVDAELFFSRSMENAGNWLREHGIFCTFFFCAGTLPDNESAWITTMHRAGHEISNHTYSHPYNLGRLPESEILFEIEENHRLLTRLAAKPEGFRSPGYHLSATVLRQLETLDYSYSSSQLTGWVYPLLKIMMMAKLRLTGKQTVSVLHPPTDVFTPRCPYFPDPDWPFFRGNSSVLEIPMAGPSWGFPSVGPLIHVFRHPWLFRVPACIPWIVNLHLTDSSPANTAADLHRVDPMLRIPLKRRLATLNGLLDTARVQNRRFLVLRDLADLETCQSRKNR